VSTGLKKGEEDEHEYEVEYGAWRVLPPVRHNDGPKGQASVIKSMVACNCNSFGLFRVLQSTSHGAVVNFSAFHSDGKAPKPGGTMPIRIWIGAARPEQDRELHTLETRLRMSDYWVAFKMAARLSHVCAHPGESFKIEVMEMHKKGIGMKWKDDYEWMTEGELVNVHWEARGCKSAWYPARIIFVRNKTGAPDYGCYDVEYEDDRREKMILRDRVRPRVRIGQRVKARLGGEPRYFAGTCIAINRSGTYVVEYDESQMTPKGTVENAVKFECIKPLSEEQKAPGSESSSKHQLESSKGPLHSSVVWHSHPSYGEVDMKVPATWEKDTYSDTIRVEDEEGNFRDMQLEIPVTLEIDPETGKFCTATSGHHSRSLGLMTSADIARDLHHERIAEDANSK